LSYPVRQLPHPARPSRLAENLSEHFRIARHVFLMAAPLGALVGATIAAYDYVVNALLWEHLSRYLPPVILSCMPIAGMFLTGLILSLCRVNSSSMADEVVLAYHRPDAGIAFKSAVPKLVASIATMGFGASAGMEGASKWLGATITSFIQKHVNQWPRLRYLHGRVETTMLAGASAGISAIFRAPLTGAIMGIESPYKHDLAHEALIHGLVAASTSYATFILFRPATPYFPIHFSYHIQPHDLIMCVPVGILGGISSHLFLGLLSKIKKDWGRWMAPRTFKTTAGGVAVTALALGLYYWIGEPATLQAGLPVANRLLNGQYLLWVCLVIFLAKLLATALTFGMGGVGGLFVPSATIGAGLGAACDVLFHPTQPGLFTLVGIAAFTGASYNSLLFAAVFVAEATGSPALVVPSLIASCAAFLVSAGVSNSQSQHQRRNSDESLLGSMLCRDWMTTKIVVAPPDQSLSHFMERSVMEHSFRELPVINHLGVFQGMVSLKSLRAVARDDWATTTVARLIDRTARTVCGTHSMAVAEKEIALGSHDYLPVVDPATDRLVGILSSSDILRARQQAKESETKSHGNVTEITNRLTHIATKEQ